MGYSFSTTTNDKITWPHLSAFDGASKLSVSLWYDPTSTDALGGIVSQIGGNITGEGGRSGFAIYHSGTDPLDVNIRARNDTTTPSAVSTGDDMSASGWMHLLMVYDGTQATNANRVRFYVNGTEITLTHTDTHSTTLGTNDRPLKIGEAEDGYGANVMAKIAELAIWAGVAITDAGEISDLASGVTADAAVPTGLTFYAPLESDANDTVVPATGTVTGATLTDHPTMSGGGGGSTFIPQVIMVL